MNINDLKKTALATAVGNDGHIDDLELQWLLSAGATSLHVNDAWSEYLISLGYEEGTLNDKLFSWAGDKGYTGSLSDRMYQVWLNGDIGGGAGVADLFSVDLWTGNGTSKDIVNNQDYVANDWLTWIKVRNVTRDNTLIDTVRGGNKVLTSNEPDAEGTSSEAITSYNSDGFSLGSLAQVNGNGNTAVCWSFKKAPKFFDIIRYTGDGVVGREIPHNIQGEVGMLWVKGFQSGSPKLWLCQHRGIGADAHLVLSTDAAIFTPSTQWNGVLANDSVVTVSNTAQNNEPGAEYIMYVFAHDPEPNGVIQCGEYTVTGGVNPDVILGWTPQYVLTKKTDSSGNWSIRDTTRGIVTGTGDKRVLANLNSAETIVNEIDLIPNGFKTNLANGNYIYMAIRAPDQEAIP